MWASGWGSNGNLLPITRGWNSTNPQKLSVKCCCNLILIDIMDGKIFVKLITYIIFPLAKMRFDHYCGTRGRLKGFNTYLTTIMSILKNTTDSSGKGQNQQDTHCGHPSPVDTVKRVSSAQMTLS